MFGCLLPGRPLQTNMQQIDETHAVFTLENPASINHICVFLLGTVPFPDGYAATVHFHWPGRGFQLLGFLSNEKPSAIFRLRGIYTPANGTTGSQTAFSSAANGPTIDASTTDAANTALLGISIEPAASVLAQCGSIPSSVPGSAPATSPMSGNAMSKITDPSALAEKTVKHLFNYLSSFSTGGGALTPETYVPLGAITKWYDIFLGKVKAGGVGFLERED